MKRLLACLMAIMMFVGTAAFAEDGAASPVGHVAAGEKHVVLLFDDGTCKALGDNAQGQCEVSAWENVISIAAGARHTVALFKDGTCAATGDNAWGQCDIGEWTDIVAVAAGQNHTVGLRADGTCVAVGIQATPDRDAWGEDEIKYDPEYNPCDVADWTDIAAVAAGYNLTMGLKKDGTVRVTGEDRLIDYYDEWEDDDGEMYAFGIDTWKNVRQIAVGPENSPLVLLNDGTVEYDGASTVFNTDEWSACSECNPGIDRFLMLDSRTISTWTDIVRLFTYGADKTDGGGQCGVTFGLRADGTILMAGEDTFGLTDVTGWTDIVDLAVGLGFAVGVKKDGTLVCAGKGDCLMEKFTKIKEATDLSLFYSDDDSPYAIAVKKDGTLDAYSDLYSAHLWDGRIDYAEDKRDVAAVACAPDGYVVLHTDGILETDCEAFKALDGLPHTTKIVAGGETEPGFVLALAVSGMVNAAGEIDVTWANVRDIAAGKYGAACAFDNGTVAVAGDVAQTLGDVSSWTDVVAVALGDNHIIGLKADGACLAAGDNACGQCEVSAWQNVVAVAAGARHTLALFADGTCAAVGDETVTHYEDKTPSDALNVSAWRDVVAVRACEGLSVGLTSTGGILLAGMNTVDLSDVTKERLWDGVRERDDAPFDADSDNVRDILERIAEEKADYEAVAQFVNSRGALGQSIRDAHPEYDDVWGEYLGLLLYKQDGLYGFLTPSGEVALNAEYDYIDRKPSGGMYVISNENGYGFADLTGAVRVPCRYWATDGYDEYGYARVSTFDTVSRRDAPYIDRDGVIVAANEEEYKAMIASLPTPAEPVTGYVSTGDENDYYNILEGYLDPVTGETVYPEFFDRAYTFEDGIGEIMLVNQRAYINERFELLSELVMPMP